MVFEKVTASWNKGINVCNGCTTICGARSCSILRPFFEYMMFPDLEWIFLVFLCCWGGQQVTFVCSVYSGLVLREPNVGSSIGWCVGPLIKLALWGKAYMFSMINAVLYY